MKKAGVLHLVDSLASGGAEHVAVMLANNLPQERYHVYVCASRQSGPLQNLIQPHVEFYDLRRKSRFDVSAIMRLAEFTRREHINLLHTHSSSLFLGVAVSLLNPELKVIWHDHTGLYGMKSRSVSLYRPFARRARAVFTVTRELERWCVQSLGLRKERILYLPNFVETQRTLNMSLDLPGKPGKRIVCVANIRAEKDHITLLRALAQVVKAEPQAHLILVGAETDPNLAEQAWQESQQLGLESNLTWLGPREDILTILENCDIGVLSSISEGFPVVILEYGRAGLSVVATQVGECAEILDEGKVGILVPPSNPELLGAALLKLLQSSDLRKQLGDGLAERIEQYYCAEVVIEKVCQIYERTL